MKKSFILLSLMITIQSYANSLPVNQLKVPAGFHISTYAQDIPGARQLAQGNKGTVFVGSYRYDNVYALVDTNHDGKADKKYLIADNLNHPNGVAFHNGDLYVGEVDKIIKYPNIEQHLAKPPKPVVVKSGLPDKLHHGARVIKFGPDGKLYMGIGVPCNICIMKNPIFGTIVRMNANGENMQTYASGVRNSVGFAWSPENKKLWFTDNGRDWLGDHLPPDEIDYAPSAGMNFGFPYVYGDNVPDPKYKHLKHPTNNFTIPAYNLPAHVAPLGMTFYTAKQFPKAYQHQIFEAEHGSWNSSKRVGYRVMELTVKDNKVTSYKPFVTGWLQGGLTILGRPVDVLVAKDGSLLISDDYAGAVYRVSYQGS